MNKQRTIIITIAVALVMLVAGVLLGTYVVKPYLDKRNDTAAKATAATFVKDLVTDKLSDAYAMTSSTLQKKQSKAEFTTAMAGLKSDAPAYGTVQVFRDGENTLYIQQVTNLPKTSTGSTAGTFYVALVKQGGSWKVGTVNVQ